jgi:hypothetical protein
MTHNALRRAIQAIAGNSIARKDNNGIALQLFLRKFADSNREGLYTTANRTLKGGNSGLCMPVKHGASMPMANAI